MQMNNAWGVCAFLRGMIRATGRERNRAGTAERRALRERRPEKTNAVRRNRRGPGENVSPGAAATPPGRRRLLVGLLIDEHARQRGSIERAA